MAMITDAQDFFTKGCGRCERFATPDCSTRRWIDDLEALRAIIIDMGLSEHAKWGHPTYMYAGRNIAIMGAFRHDFRLTFFEAGLLSDPDGVLEKQGENSQHPSMMRFTALGQVAEQEETIRAYLREAMGYAQQGIHAPAPTREVDVPEELTEALAADPELAEAFDALTPGRQKSWSIHIGAAKKSQTRADRAARAREKIMAGKGALER
ncbi:MAG: YdeI/OmpD-associated family protein [Nostocoides sp.]